MSSTHSDAAHEVEFSDVYMVSGFSKLAEDFNPKFYDGLGDLHVESLEYIDRSERYRDDTQENRGLFRVFVIFGVRWASKEASEASEAPDGSGDEVDAAEQDEERILATIEGGFVVEYLVPDDMAQEYLDDYALQNSVAHAFPFWRDYFLGQCSKMRLNTARLPRRIVGPLGVIRA